MDVCVTRSCAGCEHSRMRSHSRIRWCHMRVCVTRSRVCGEDPTIARRHDGGEAVEDPRPLDTEGWRTHPHTLSRGARGRQQGCVERKNPPVVEATVLVLVVMRRRKSPSFRSRSEFSDIIQVLSGWLVSQDVRT